MRRRTILGLMLVTAPVVAWLFAGTDDAPAPNASTSRTVQPTPAPGSAPRDAVVHVRQTSPPPAVFASKGDAGFMDEAVKLDDAGATVAATESAVPPAPGTQVVGAPRADSRRERDALLARAAARVTAPGLCEERKAREALVEGFRRIDLAEGVIVIDPMLPEEIIVRVGATLRVARERVAELIAPSAEVSSPSVVVYRSLNQMRSVSCVNTSAYGYYDGAIHLSGNPNGGAIQLEQTVLHEFVHHVLLQQGVRLPMWLSEGIAMLVANERWWEQPELGLLAWARSTHLPFDQLVPAFAHATDEQTATQLYFQSFLMVELIRGRGGLPAIRALIARLGQGLVSPDDAFTDALQVSPAQVDAVYQQWVQTVRHSCASASGR